MADTSDTLQDRDKLIAACIDAGIALIPLDEGTKRTEAAGWNLPGYAIYTHEQAAERLSGKCNIGMANAFCTPNPVGAIDIDNMTGARQWLKERGVDLDALLADPAAVRIDSGREGRAKLLYRLPHTMPTYKVANGGLELRCASKDGKTVQDVLPPSIHPDTGRPYRLIGDIASIPPIPAALLAAWEGVQAERAAQQPELTLDLGRVDQAALAARLAVVQADPDLKLLMEGKPPMWLTDKSRNGFDFALALVLNRLHFTPDESALCISNYEFGKAERHSDEKYIGDILRKVYAPKETAVSDPDSPRARDEYFIASFAERRKNRKPNRWQVKGRFRQGTINIIFGSSGTYKSTTMAGLAVSLQCRPRWHDSNIENSGGGILIIAAEDDEGVVDMVEAACLEYGEDPDKVQVYITHGGYDLSNPEVIQGIKGAIATMPAPLSAIIIDTLNRNCGELDENSASDMRNFLNKLDELRGDATVYVIHHNGHTEKERERGAYAIRCNADSSVLCTFDEDSQLFTMEWKKLRSAPLPKNLTLKPRIITIRQEADSTGVLEDVTAVCMVMSGEAHRNARVEAFYAKYPELGAGERRKYLKVLMSRLLNKPGETQKALATLCGHSQSTIRDTLIALRERGFVTGEKEPLKLTKAGVEVLNELALDVAVAFKEQGVDIQLLAMEKTLEAVLEAKNALLQ